MVRKRPAAAPVDDKPEQAAGAALAPASALADGEVVGHNQKRKRARKNPECSSADPQDQDSLSAQQFDDLSAMFADIACDPQVPNQQVSDVRFLEPLLPVAGDNPPYEKAAGKYSENGFQQLEDWIWEALDRLGSTTKAELAFYQEKFFDMGIATACSGSDSPVLVAQAFHNVCKNKFNSPGSFQHVFSCESDTSKIEFIAEMFKDTGLQHLFMDAQHLCSPADGDDDCDVPLMAVDVLCADEVEVPDCSLFVAGFPCQDVSKLNNMALKNRFVVRDTEARTGKVFSYVNGFGKRQMRRRAKRLRAKRVRKQCGTTSSSLESKFEFKGMLLENVVGLATRPPGIDPDTNQPFFTNLEYCAAGIVEAGMMMIPFELDPRLFGFPVLNLLGNNVINCIRDCTFQHLYTSTIAFVVHPRVLVHGLRKP
jgi:hypothetical protein